MAAQSHDTFVGIIGHGPDLIEQEQFWDKVADEAYRREFAAWDAWL